MFKIGDNVMITNSKKYRVTTYGSCGIITDINPYIAIINFYKITSPYEGYLDSKFEIYLTDIVKISGNKDLFGREI